nr:putative ribonuclease H-like domain-containing protein [Tanacetum cinerariifolium]
TIVATSTTEAEYVVAASDCGQVLWIQNQLLDYGKLIMEKLAFYDYHNMVAILEKYEHNVNFHQIVDFIEASHIRIETTDEGTKILATVDGNPITISESSIRRNLKLKDEAGISSSPDAELFENLVLMGVGISVGVTVGIILVVTDGWIDDERSCCGDCEASGEGV